MDAVELTERTSEKPKWEDRFIDLLAADGNITYAARNAGVSRVTVYEHRKQRPEFAARWAEAEALGVEALEDEAKRRALTESDTLLIFMLKSKKPAVYRDTSRHEITGADGEPFKVFVNIDPEKV